MKCFVYKINIMNGRGSIHVGVAMARLGYFDIVPLHVHVRRDLGMR